MAASIKTELCVRAASLFQKDGLLRKCGFRRSEIIRFDSMEAWVDDRIDQIDSYVELFRPFADFDGKTVLELGCNQGYLLHSFRSRFDFEAIGADIDSDALAVANERYGEDLTFVESTPTSIPVNDASVDIVYTIDTIEHLSSIEEIFRDCFRILKPGGTMLCHFSAWYTPYGSHLEDIIPIPWANSLFSMNTLLNAAGKIYDSPGYEVACYWRDEKSGRKKPNPYLDKVHWNRYLNRITIRQFRKLLERLPFKTVHLTNIGFGGKTFKLGRFLAPAANFPITEEFFTKATFAVLQKPRVDNQIASQTNVG